MCDKKSFLIVQVCLLLLILGTSLLGCSSSPSTTDSVSSWIKAHALPLKTTDPKASLDDLRVIPQLVGSASIVGLGEATHGSHEFFTMKHRLLEALVEKMGFTMFAMECGVSVGEKINTYVLTGQGNDRDLVRQFYEWPWQTQEVLDLIDWMRSYNADSTHLQKVRFAGFDPQIVDTITYDDVLGYMHTVDPQRASAVASLYGGLRPDPSASFTQYRIDYQQLSLDNKALYLQHAQQVYDLLTQQQAGYEARTSPQTFAQTLQDARVIVQYAQIMSTTSLQGVSSASHQRDAFMAEDVAWLHDHAEGGQKLVLWAHNGHIQATPLGNGPNMGTYLRQRYHTAYLAIGTSFSQGAFNARRVDNAGQMTAIQSFTIQGADHGSYNDMFGQTGLSIYALDLRHLPNGAVGKWLDGPHPFLEAEGGYAPGDWPYASISLPASFDVIIYIQKVTASTILAQG